MNKRIKHSLETRIRAAELFGSGFGYRSVAGMLSIPDTTSRGWRDQYRSGQLLGLGVMSPKVYPVELKIAAVEAFLSGSSTTEVVARFEISDRSIFNKWLAAYRVDGLAGLHPKKKGRPTRVVSTGSESLEEEVLRLRLENAVLKKLEALMIEDDPRFWEKPESSSH